MVANKTCYESSWPETKQNLRHDARSDCASVVKYNEASNQLCQALSLQLSLSHFLVQSLSFPFPIKSLHCYTGAYMRAYVRLRFPGLCLWPNNCKN
jgi:hypothetical protein